MGKIFEIGSDLVTVGRETGNAIVMSDDSTASRRHARIIRQDGKFFIQDEGSANGTVVNGVRISSQTQISTGDEIQIGSTRFRFEV